MNEGHDHAKATHAAKCDAKDCEYVALVHAHEEDEAVHLLSQDLALHNKEVHGVETNAEEIEEPVRMKIKTIN